MYTIIHAILGYFFLLFVVRLLSRRPGGQLTPFEFVIVFLIGGLIILATVGDDKSATNCVGAILTIGLMHHITARVRASSPRISTMVDGVPVVLLDRGKWQTEAMHGMRIDDQDVMAMARAKGIRSLDGVNYAVLERVGSISIIPKKEEKEES
jgi:uncharacterized membrane protein YcaP (DUF421 family)